MRVLLAILLLLHLVTPLYADHAQRKRRGFSETPVRFAIELEGTLRGLPLVATGILFHDQQFTIEFRHPDTNEFMFKTAGTWNEFEHGQAILFHSVYPGDAYVTLTLEQHPTNPHELIQTEEYLTGLDFSKVTYIEGSESNISALVGKNPWVDRQSDKNQFRVQNDKFLKELKRKKRQDNDAGNPGGGSGARTSGNPR